jgi:hypothetical protein
MLLLLPSYAKAARPATASRAPVTKRAPKAAPQPARLLVKPSRLEVGPGEKGLVVEITITPPGRKRTQAMLSADLPAGVTLDPEAWTGEVPPWGAKAYLKLGALPATRAGGLVRFRATFLVSGAAATGDLVAEVTPPLAVAIKPDPVGSSVKVWVRNLLKQRPLRVRAAITNKDRFLQNVVSGMTPELGPGRSAEVTIPVISDGIAPDVPYRFEATAQTFQGYRTKVARQLTFLTAPRRPQPPVVDGSLKGWEDAYVVVARGAVAGRLSGVTGRVVWDDENLYLQVRAVDRRTAAPGPRAGAGAVDSLQVAIDPAGLHLPYSPWILVTAQPSSEPSGASVSAAYSAHPERHGLPGAKATWSWRDGLGTYTLALPWSELGMQARVGLTFGFSFRAEIAEGSSPGEGLGWGTGIVPTLDPQQFGDLTLGGSE